MILYALILIHKCSVGILTRFLSIWKEMEVNKPQMQTIKDNKGNNLKINKIKTMTKKTKTLKKHQKKTLLNSTDFLTS